MHACSPAPLPSVHSCWTDCQNCGPYGDPEEGEGSLFNAHCAGLISHLIAQNVSCIYILCAVCACVYISCTVLYTLQRQDILQMNLRYLCVKAKGGYFEEQTCSGLINTLFTI